LVSLTLVELRGRRKNDQPGDDQPEISYEMLSNRPNVRGINLDPQTRCEHYHGPTDIIAIKMKCCGVYYACKDCHVALADHQIETWPESEWNQQAILCGACGTELTIIQYLQSQNRCPSCREHFNPGCRNHYHFYFQLRRAPSKSISNLQ
jgi:uncharacterized CHY-type Zn-finger protein